MLKHTRRAGTVTAYLDGELDQHTAQALRAELEALIEPDAVRELVLDVSKLSFMDSSGIGVIIGRYKTMARKGGNVSVQGASPRIDRIFELSGLYRIVERKSERRRQAE